MVGKPKGIVRGRPMTTDEEADYVREVAAAKTEVLRTSLDAVDRQHMPFRGETGGVGAGQGMGKLPGSGGAGSAASPRTPASHRQIPLDPELAARLDEVRQAAADHAAHASTPPPTPAQRRAPRPERLEH
jgi:hypothetical protein